MKTKLLIPLIVALLAPEFSIGQEDPAHEELRTLRNGILEAITKGDINAQLEFVHPDVVITWQNQVVKLSEDQNLVSGISLTAMGDSVLAVWRRAGDNNDFDSIMYAYTTNRGKKWTKGAVLADICSFDQLSETTAFSVTFRTNDFPWAANDGKNFYVFYSDRNFDGASNCTG